MPDTHGYAHVAITVKDHAVSLPFYEKVFGAGPVGEIVTDDFDRKIFSIGNDQIMGVTMYKAGIKGRFDFLNAGLDHIGLNVPDRDTVFAIQERLAAVGITGDLVEVDYGTVFNIKDPDGVAIEFFGPPAS